MKIIWMEYTGQPLMCDFSCVDDVEKVYDFLQDVS